MAHLLVVSDVRYLQNWASDGVKTWIFGEKSLYFQSHLHKFGDIRNRRPRNDAPCNAAQFTDQSVNSLINIGGPNQGNSLAKTGT